MAALASGPRLRVFLSYARQDGSALAEELSTGLELLGFSPVLDRRDIAAAEDWQERLAGLIRAADTVLFLLSPHAVRSSRCAWEVEQAVAQCKRVVPVVAVAVAEEEVPPALRRLNYLFFDGSHSFMRSLAELADALRLDWDWIREHTRLGELAARWVARERDASLLLRGQELSAAVAWQRGWHAGAPAVTDIQRDFIDQSTRAEAEREDAELQRVAALAQANATRAAALADREAALASLRRRTLVGGGAAAALSTALAISGWQMLRSQRDLVAAREAEAEARQRSLEKAIEREAMRTDVAGQVVAYAASPGQNAEDDSGFSAALIEQLDRHRASLAAALQLASRHVLDKTQGRQRPYIASDLNADLFLRRSPPTRQRRALVVTVEYLARNELPGTIADGRAWDRFLRDCGIATQWLRNPTREAMLLAVAGMNLAATTVPSGWARSAALRLSGAASSPPASAAASAPHLLGEPPLPAALPPRARKPPPDTFMIFVYSGTGDRVDGQDCLGTVNQVVQPAERAEVLKTRVLVSEVSQWLRTNAAASCMVLDTEFLDPGRGR